VPALGLALAFDLAGASAALTGFATLLVIFLVATACLAGVAVFGLTDTFDFGFFVAAAAWPGGVFFRDLGCGFAYRR